LIDYKDYEMREFLCDDCKEIYPRVYMVQNNYKNLCRSCYKGVKPVKKAPVEVIVPKEEPISAPKAKKSRKK